MHGLVQNKGDSPYTDKQFLQAESQAHCCYQTL